MALTKAPGAGRPWPDLAAFLGFLVLVFAAKLQALSVPSDWDEVSWAGAAHFTALRICETRSMSVSPGYTWAHQR